jgi:2-keto-4-pentenoate hydratase/2-oxohepta-3-ene-1,7-dioic acid hydratase in catechol pathway
MRVFRIDHRGAARYARTADSQATQLELLTAAPWSGGSDSGERVALAGARLLAPVTPSKIVCVGRNYAAHAKELGNAVPSEPLLFLKPPSGLLASEETIVIPPGVERAEHEAEIGVVIGVRIKQASLEVARKAIFGVTCVNDVTARDVQRKDVQFTRAKGYDTFCPVGPWIDTSLSIDELTVSARVNGQQRQHAPVSEMVTPIAALVSFISHAMTLEPGDLISTGTPEGVGQLVAGDTVEIEVSGGLILRNTVA